MKKKKNEKQLKPHLHHTNENLVIRLFTEKHMRFSATVIKSPRTETTKTTIRFYVGGMKKRKKYTLAK